MLVYFDRNGLASIGALHDHLVVLPVGQVVGRIELEVVEAKVKSHAHSTVVVHFEGEVVREAFFVTFVRHDLFKIRTH